MAIRYGGLDDGEYLITAPSFYWNGLPVWNLDNNIGVIPNTTTGGINAYQTTLHEVDYKKYLLPIIAIFVIYFFIKRKK